MIVTDARGEAVSLAGGRLLLEEARDYILIEDTGAAVWLGARRLVRSGKHVALKVGHLVGATVLSVVQEDGGREDTPVEIQPRAAKLSTGSWVELLRDLERWLPGVSVGLEAARQGGVGVHGSDSVPAERLAEALYPLIPDLQRAVAVVLASPRELLRRREDLIPMRKLRRVDTATLRHLQRHPREACWLRDAQAGPEPLLPHHPITPSVDHPANRYLCWLLLRITAILRRTAARLRALAGSTSRLNETEVWCVARASRLEDAADALSRQHRRSFLRHLAPQPPTEAALLVIQDEPAYARVHAIGRRFLSPRFQLDADEHRPAARPSYDLYELWTFFAVKDALAAALPDWSWTPSGLEQLLSVTGTGEGAQWSATDGHSTSTLSFNPTFSSFFARRGRARWSVSGERRPDLVLTWETPGEAGRWICLDAKYRTGRRNLTDAFTSLHLYRDALRYTGLGPRCQSAFLLAPARSEDAAVWFSEAFRRDWDMGIWALTPGEALPEAFAPELLSRLRGGDSPPQASVDSDQPMS